jgi:hypothetical protein
VPALAWKFRKSVKILPGVKLNFSNSGVSTSFGPKGFKYNVGRKGVRRTVSILGSGIYHTEMLEKNDNGKGELPPPDRSKRIPFGKIAFGFIFLALVSQCFKERPSDIPARENPTTAGVIAPIQNKSPSPQSKADAQVVAASALVSTGINKEDGKVELAAKEAAPLIKSDSVAKIRSHKQRKKVYCSCRSNIRCTGPRGGQYCVTASGNKQYGR